MNWLTKLRRAFTTTKSDTMLFPVENGKDLDFERLALFKTGFLQSFPLHDGQILRRVGSPHWAILLHFVCNGMYYGLRVDRAPEPQPPGNSSVSLSSHDSSTMPSQALKNIGVSDRVTGYPPEAKAPWSDLPEGYSRICWLDLPPSHNITLLDVALGLSSTHRYKPSYRLVGYNCRWLAKAVALALEQLARRHQESSMEEWKQHQELFFERTRCVDPKKKQLVRKAVAVVLRAYQEAVS